MSFSNQSPVFEWIYKFASSLAVCVWIKVNSVMFKNILNRCIYSTLQSFTKPRFEAEVEEKSFVLYSYI